MTVLAFQIENGTEVELPEGWEFLAVASSDSFRTWLLLRKLPAESEQNQHQEEL